METSPDVYDWSAVLPLDQLFTAAVAHDLEPPHPAAPNTHWERNNMGWIQVYNDPRIYNPDGTLKK